MRKALVTATFVAAALTAPFAVADEPFGPAMTKTTELGTILVGPDGFTLYVYDADRPGVSTCERECALDWPPFTVLGNEDLADEDWTIVDNVAGLGAMLMTRQMWAYKGQPLYYYAGDDEPGDMNGNDRNGRWEVVVIEPAE